MWKTTVRVRLKCYGSVAYILYYYDRAFVCFYFISLPLVICYLFHKIMLPNAYFHFFDIFSKATKRGRFMLCQNIT